jgi:hypothetical protein
VKSGGTWQVEHFAVPLKSVSPLSNAAASYDPAGAFGAGIESW